MRTIPLDQITQVTYELALDAAFILDTEIVDTFQAALDTEDNEQAKFVLKNILKNQEIARSKIVPMCQDTGIVICFVEVGNEVYIPGDLNQAIQNGVRKAYKDGYLRKSVADPITRENTHDNTPAIIHYKQVVGDTLTIHILPKGAGSENMSRQKMLTPQEGLQGIEDFVLETVQIGGGKACPPLIVGVGIGGDFEKSALLAKEALLRPLNQAGSEPHIVALETKLLSQINALDIGPMGFGGKTTAIKVSILTAPTHIASLPIAVNLSCHAHRHKSKVI